MNRTDSNTGLRLGVAGRAVRSASLLGSPSDGAVRVSRPSVSAAVNAALTSLLVACFAGSSLAAESGQEKEKETKPPEPAAEAEEPRTYNNWVEVSAGGLFFDGDKAALRQRHQIQNGAFGGIEDFHWGKEIGKKGSLQIDGRALFDNDDYAIRLELKNPDIGFVRGGYRQFTTWYDGSGGFLPQTRTWISLSDDALGLDRGEAWFEGGLTLPSFPSIIFKYTHQFRDGQKDSTSWGFVHPGIGGDVRGISPSFWDIDERRDIFQLDVKHTIQSTDFGVGLRYETSDNDNALKVRQFPNESGVDRHLTSRQEVQTDMFTVHAFTDTRFKEAVRFTTGFLFTTLDTDLGGDRIYGNDFDVGYNPLLTQGVGFLGLSGGSQMKEYVANLNLMLTPSENFSIIPSVRVEKQDIDSLSSFLQTGAILVPDGPVSATSSRDLLEVSERLELRYVGVTNWVFYARGDWTEGDGDLRESGGVALDLPVLRYTDDTTWIQKYTAGANWYPLRNLSLDAQYYYKQRRNSYDHEIDSTPNNDIANRYPAYLRRHDFDTHDANIRITWRPLNRLSLVSRYDFQYSTIETRPDSISGLSEIESARVSSHIFGQNITWVPWSRIYLQAGFNYVVSTTETPADRYTQAILDSENNYWNLSFTTGFALDQKTDLQVSYFYYRADNYEDNSADGVPYGVGAEEHNITVGLMRRIGENLRVALKYGFFDWDDETSGGKNNYEAHLVYSSLQYRF
jgi:hypothetical protein